MRKRSASEAPAQMRYHLLGADDLYKPIPFLFVTDRMCQEIAAERQQILGSLPAPKLERQRKLFDRYNPTHSSAAFNAMLRLVNPHKD